MPLSTQKISFWAGYLSRCWVTDVINMYMSDLYCSFCCFVFFRWTAWLGRGIRRLLMTDIPGTFRHTGSSTGPWLEITPETDCLIQKRPVYKGAHVFIWNYINYQRTKTIFMREVRVDARIFPMTDLNRKNKALTDRMKWHLSLTESLWALQFWTPLLPLLPLQISTGLPCMGKERQRGYCTEQKAPCVKLRMSTAPVHVLWKQRRCQRTTMCFHFISL